MSDEAASVEGNGKVPFRLLVESAHLAGRSMTIVAGRWEQGTFYPGDYLELVKTADGQHECRRVRGAAIDTFRLPGRDPSLGMLFGVIVEGVSPGDVSAGDVLRAANGEEQPPAAAKPPRNARRPFGVRKWLSRPRRRRRERSSAKPGV